MVFKAGSLGYSDMSPENVFHSQGINILAFKVKQQVQELHSGGW